MAAAISARRRPSELGCITSVFARLSLETFAASLRGGTAEYHEVSTPNGISAGRADRDFSPLHEARAPGSTAGYRSRRYRQPSGGSIDVSQTAVATGGRLCRLGVGSRCSPVARLPHPE